MRPFKQWMALSLVASLAGAPTVGSAAIPSATDVDHIGITVPDLEQATRFFEDVIGAQRVYTFAAGPGTASPKSLADRFGVPASAHLEGAFFRLGPNINLELLQYTAPDQRQGVPLISDNYTPHIAFFVDNLDVAANYLGDHGCRPLSGPVTAEDGPNKGQINRYVQTPIGLTIELIKRPAQQPYQDTTPARLYGPAASWDAR